MAGGRVAIIDGSLIEDFDSFHDVVAKAFGFPEGYGRNWGALYDFLFFLDEDHKTTTFFVEPGEIVTIRIDHASLMRQRVPEIFDGFVRSCASVNGERLEQGETAYLCLAFIE